MGLSTQFEKAGEIMDWDKAENYLNMLIEEYKSIGCTGLFALSLTLIPLKNRLDKGERTESLYNEIMECE